MFNYKKFENEVAEQIRIALEMWAKENDDLYIFSLACTREMNSIGVVANTIQFLDAQANPDSEDYWYYKYCEEEWDLLYTFEAISNDMCKYADDNKAYFINSETHEYTEAFDNHCNKIIQSCKKTLISLREAMPDGCANIFLTLNIRDYLDGAERIGFFEKMNDCNATKEYSEHIEDFA